MSKKQSINAKGYKLLIIGLSVIVVVALGYAVPKLLSGSAADSKTQDTSGSSSQSPEKTDAPEYMTDDGDKISDVELVEVGQYMQFATQKMRVNSAKLTDTISDGSSYTSPSVAGEGVKFLVINITVENTSVSPFSYRDFSLFTSKNSQIEKQYSAYSSYGEIENYIDGRELQPGIPETGNVVYRVPDDKKEFQLGGAVSGTSKALHTRISL